MKNMNAKCTTKLMLCLSCGILAYAPSAKSMFAEKFLGSSLRLTRHSSRVMFGLEQPHVFSRMNSMTRSIVPQEEINKVKAMSTSLEKENPYLGRLAQRITGVAEDANHYLNLGKAYSLYADRGLQEELSNVSQNWERVRDEATKLSPRARNNYDMIDSFIKNISSSLIL